MIRKLVLTGGTRERELQLVGRIVVGRDPGCEISHDDSLLSRRHAEFIAAADTITVRDLGSRNGVYVNGARAVERVLTPGDIVQIGPLRAQFVVEDAPASILPEEAEGDRTAVIRKVFAGTRAEPGGPLVTGVATLDADDDEVTRMVAAPILPGGETPMTNSYAARMLFESDAPTQFLPAPPAAAPRSAPLAVASGVSIVVPILSLAMIVLAATAIPLLLGAASGWLVVPALIAVAGSYLVASSLHRRMLEGAAADRERT